MSQSSRAVVLDGELECPICSEPFVVQQRQPIVLPCCGQTVCAICVQTMKSSGQSHSSQSSKEPIKQQTCALCIQPTELSRPIVNRALCEIIMQSRTQHEETANQQKNLDYGCDACLEAHEMLTAPAYYCLKCFVWMCELHNRPHQRLDHRQFVHSFNEIQSSEKLKQQVKSRCIIRKCPLHGEDNLLLRWCTDCKKPICRLCIENEHATHTLHTLEYMMTQCDTKLSGFASSMSVCMTDLRQFQQRDSLQKNAEIRRVKQDSDHFNRTIASDLAEHVSTLISEATSIVITFLEGHRMNEIDQCQKSFAELVEHYTTCSQLPFRRDVAQHLELISSFEKLIAKCKQIAQTPSPPFTIGFDKILKQTNELWTREFGLALSKINQAFNIHDEQKQSDSYQPSIPLSLDPLNHHVNRIPDPNNFHLSNDYSISERHPRLAASILQLCKPMERATFNAAAGSLRVIFRHLHSSRFLLD